MSRHRYSSSGSTSSTGGDASSARTKSTSRTIHSTTSSPGGSRCISNWQDAAQGLAKEQRHREPSVVTYASTEDSDDEDDDTMDQRQKRLRRTIYASDAIPASAPDFAELFPSTSKLLIHHDDSTADGNMNLRLDTEISTSHGRKVKMTLFHLRMTDLSDRKFSLRRYCRDSGREVCHSARKYVKPLEGRGGQRSSLSRAITSASQKLHKYKSRRQQDDSGYETDDNLAEEKLQLFTALSEVEATIATDTIRLEFSNYALVEVKPVHSLKAYNFEYWGVMYQWQCPTGENAKYLLVDLTSQIVIAQIRPELLTRRHQLEEELEGAWIRPSKMRIIDRAVIEDHRTDIADVIVATGLVVLVDSHVRRAAQRQVSPWRERRMSRSITSGHVPQRNDSYTASLR